MDAEAERLIEKYLRRPEALAKRERQRVDQLLAHDAAAEAYAEFLRTFYQRLGEETDRGRSSQVEEFVEALFEDTRDSVVQLRPFRPRGKPQSTVLAAATQPASGDRRFSVLTTLEGEQEEVLVRVIGDHKTGQGRVYVLTDPLAGQGHIIVSFPDLGLDLVTDEDGRRTFELPPEVSSEEWKEAVAVVRRPVATRRLAPECTVTFDGASGAPVECRHEEGTLVVTVQTEGAGVPSLLTVEAADTDGRILLRLREGEAVRQSIPDSEELLLRLYE